jgi:uncharacterized membrane protein YkoI
MNRYIKSTTSIIAVVALAVGMLLTAFHSEVLGQVNTTSSKNTPAAKPSTTAGAKQGNLPTTLPNITGSIPLGSTISGAISSKVKTALSEAIIAAQKTVGSNSSATLAFIRPLNGYLVYDIHVRNNSNNTPYAVIVDPGNGKVLYKQTLPSSSSFAAGHTGMFGKDRTGPFFGGYGRGCGGHGHSSNGGFMNYSGAGNFAGIDMHMSTTTNYNGLNDIGGIRV